MPIQRQKFNFILVERNLMNTHRSALFRKVKSAVATIKAHGKSTICVKSLLRCGTTPQNFFCVPKVITCKSHFYDRYWDLGWLWAIWAFALFIPLLSIEFWLDFNIIWIDKIGNSWCFKSIVLFYKPSIFWNDNSVQAKMWILCIALIEIAPRMTYKKWLCVHQ